MADDSGSNGGRGRTSPRTDLAVTLSRLARSLQDNDNADDTLRAIVYAAVDTIPGAHYAALSVVQRRREVRTEAGTDELVYLVDQAQYETGQGPCLDAVYQQRTVRLSDMSTEQRWPEFTGRAQELGVRSMLSFQLFVQHDNLGALNLYSRQLDAFDGDSEHIGLLFATHAAVAMSGAQQQDHLNKALAARDAIGQAKGILMERHRLTADQAFSVLARASQESNIRLVEVARALNETGQLDRTAG
ncbi:GAF and ANTAR domain-containing protein [Actinoplanes sp. NPDC048967]|uniref:GAF and ANTAR domain-containing protein n=1 Tax=Actinoplanes sp. NPDC048967 TaxID=3155269 RepID=UPI0033FD5B2E